MNNFFNYHRWSLLVSKHWSENRKKYSLSLIAIAGLLLVWYIFSLLVNEFNPIDYSYQIGTYYFGLFFIGCLYASMLFADLASKSKGINYLAVPASHFEKLLCTLFYAVVAFFICYTVVFYIVDIPMVKLSNAIASAHWQKTYPGSTPFVPAKICNIFLSATNSRDANTENSLLYFLLIFFSIQTTFLLGSVYFPKFSFIKTVLALLIVSFFFTVFVSKVLSPFLPTGYFYQGITSYSFTEGGVEKIIQLPEWINGALRKTLEYGYIPIIWLVTYFRLKEKEI
jgi:hypothetical protein